MNEFFASLLSRLQSLLYIIPAVIPAIVCHECAHGYVSYLLGDPTAKDAGRLTLNPIKHLDLMGFFCLVFFRFGWAKPVPIDPTYYKNRKTGIILVSIAGPLTNFLLAFICTLLMGATLRFMPLDAKITLILYTFLYYSAIINVGLGLFNLVPLPPLDGSKIVGELSLTMRKFYYNFRQYWQIILIICLLTGIVSTPLSVANDWIINGMWTTSRLIFGLT
ncbi:MAG: site-2 protease family protein [Clostridia bacterium]|nr:site-2 protease family protein [Clostridia bacterium]